MSRIAATSILIAALGACLLGGCLHSPVMEQWGTAQTSNTAAMIANPDAPAWGTAPVGLDPGTAERVAERYYEGQLKGRTEAAREQFLVIGE